MPKRNTLFYEKPKSVPKPNRSAVWNKIRNEVVKPAFRERGITYCENCKWEVENGHCSYLTAVTRPKIYSFHHRHKRNWYKQFTRQTEELLLGVFEQVMLVCAECHNRLEYDRELNKSRFQSIKGAENPQLQEQ